MMFVHQPLAYGAASLETRFRPPSGPADLLARPRLTGALLAAFERPLTLVCAPAGYGKTTALTVAAVESRWPVAWLSLRQRDDETRTFLADFVAAVRTQFPEACRDTLSLLQLPALPAPSCVGEILAQDLEDLPTDLLLVLDDYQVIQQPDIHAMLNALLRQPPAPLHLVIAARGVPPLALGRLRASEQLTELDPSQFQFQPAEARAFLERAAGVAAGGIGAGYAVATPYGAYSAAASPWGAAYGVRYY